MTLSRIAFTLLFTSIVFTAYSQEMLINLSSYPTSNIKTKKSKSILELPFFDDFAQNAAVPSSELWESSSVICNQSYAINPPTIGVATFDAINYAGELFETLSTTPQGADTLTSLPINLNVAPTEYDSIYLSFCIQPQGLGYAPSSKDSLVLEFWDGADLKWIRVWSASYNSENKTLTQKNFIYSKSKITQSDTINKCFTNAMININSTAFLTSNFKFRFINYASLEESTLIPGRKSNTDHWHLDMVYLNKNRNFNDTVFDDVAFVKPIGNLMKNCTSIPWKHLSAAYSAEFPNPLTIYTYYKNLGPVTWNVSRSFQVSDLSGSQAASSFSGGEEDILPYTQLNYSRFFDYSFTSAWADSAKFKIQSNLTLYNIANYETTPSYLMHNDTVSRTFEFDNYYALDDGSAEFGYGLRGEGTEDGMVAYKFHNYKADTLKGVMMYFNKAYEAANQVKFILTIWDDASGVPGEIAYQRSSVLPQFSDSLNKFIYYRTDPTFIPEGDFYVGWVQTETVMLNVGFDLNINNQNKIFYNITGAWGNTQQKGSLMIRPIFGNMHQKPTSIETSTVDNPKITIYPNPANDCITIKANDNFNVSSVQVINATGSVVLSQLTSNQETISIQSLPQGLYIVKVCPKIGRCTTSKLLIVR